MTESTPSAGRVRAVGIDLGTTNSLLAYLDESGRPQTVSNRLGDLLTPSAVLVDQGDLCVGRFAVEGASLSPLNYISGFKRDVGREFCRQKIAGLKIPPEICSAFVLARVKADAEEKLGEIKQAVVTVPAFFDETRRRSTQEAGALAGLDVVDLLNEPTAAAVAYGYHLGFLDLERDNTTQSMRFLVYDLGGGTFDVTVLELKGRHIRALATDGDVRLGGRDFDKRLIDHLAEEAIRREGFDPRIDPIDLARLTDDAQVLKHALSERQRATVMVPCGAKRARVDVTRAQFEDLTRDLVERTETTCRSVLKEANTNWSQIDRVLMVGGSSRLPMVAQMLQEMAGKAPDHSQSPDEVVAQGAALYCGLRLKVSRPRFHLTNVNSHAVGVLSRRPKTGEEVNATLIPKNSPLPAEARKVFRTAAVNQTSVLVTVVEGEGHTPDTYNLLGKCVVRGLPPDMPKGTEIQVIFHLSASGLLEVRAEVPSVKCSAVAIIERTRKRNLESLSEWTERLIAASKAPPPGSGEVKALPDAKAPAASQPAAESEPAVEKKPASEAKPQAAKPASEVKSTAEAKPAAAPVGGGVNGAAPHATPAGAANLFHETIPIPVAKPAAEAKPAAPAARIPVPAAPVDRDAMTPAVDLKRPGSDARKAALETKAPAAPVEARNSLAAQLIGPAGEPRPSASEAKTVIASAAASPARPAPGPFHGPTVTSAGVSGVLPNLSGMIDLALNSGLSQAPGSNVREANAFAPFSPSRPEAASPTAGPVAVEPGSSSHVLAAPVVTSSAAGGSSSTLQPPPGYPPNLTEAQLTQRMLELYAWLGQQLLRFPPSPPLAGAFHAARGAFESFQQTQGALNRLFEQRPQLPAGMFEQAFSNTANRLEEERKRFDVASQNFGRQAHETGLLPPPIRPHLAELDYLRSRLGNVSPIRG